MRRLRFAVQQKQSTGPYNPEPRKSEPAFRCGLRAFAGCYMFRIQKNFRMSSLPATRAAMTTTASVVPTMSFISGPSFLLAPNLPRACLLAVNTATLSVQADRTRPDCSGPEVGIVCAFSPAGWRHNRGQVTAAGPQGPDAGPLRARPGWP